jgi:hypothetical protein
MCRSNRILLRLYPRKNLAGERISDVLVWYLTAILRECRTTGSFLPSDKKRVVSTTFNDGAGAAVVAALLLMLIRLRLLSRRVFTLDDLVVDIVAAAIVVVVYTIALVRIRKIIALINTAVSCFQEL